MHDPSQTVDTNRKIDGRSASGKSEWKAERWRDPSEAYRAAVSFNEEEFLWRGADTK
jgi:hypothetical protein